MLFWNVWNIFSLTSFFVPLTGQKDVRSEKKQNIGKWYKISLNLLPLL